MTYQLQVVYLFVQTAFTQQFIMCAALDNDSLYPSR